MTQDLHTLESLIYDYFSEAAKREKFTQDINKAREEFHKKQYRSCGKILAKILQSIFCYNGKCSEENDAVDPKLKFFLSGEHSRIITHTSRSLGESWTFNSTAFIRVF